MAHSSEHPNPRQSRFKEGVKIGLTALAASVLAASVVESVFYGLKDRGIDLKKDLGISSDKNER